MAFKILVNSRFGGGAELQAELLAKAMKPDSFLVLDGPRGVFPESLSHSFAALPGALKTLLMKFYASRLAAQCGPGDTVLSFMQRSNFVNVLAARSSGHRAVICEVTQPSREFSGLRGRLMRPLIRELYPEAPLVLANSKGNARDLEENFGFPRGKVKVIYNACDTAGLAEKMKEPLEARYENLFARPVLVTSGRLTAAKAHWRLLRVFAEARKSSREPVLLFLGDGELRERLFALCGALGLSAWDAAGEAPLTGREDVVFAGFQQNPFKFLARARLFLFPSLWEGLPNAVIEALACGLPVIAADCRSGPRELLAPATEFTEEAVMPEHLPCGFLMPPFKITPPDFSVTADGREKLWAATILGLLKDPKTHASMAAACRERAKDFSLKVKVPEWLGTLDL